VHDVPQDAERISEVILGSYFPAQRQALL